MLAVTLPSDDCNLNLVSELVQRVQGFWFSPIRRSAQLQIPTWNIKRGFFQGSLAVLFPLNASHSSSRRHGGSERQRDGDRERGREMELCGRAQSSAERREHPRVSQTFYTHTVHSHNSYTTSTARDKDYFESADSRSKPPFVCLC